MVGWVIFLSVNVSVKKETSLQSGAFPLSLPLLFPKEISSISCSQSLKLKMGVSQAQHWRNIWAFRFYCLPVSGSLCSKCFLFLCKPIGLEDWINLWNNCHHSAQVSTHMLAVQHCGNKWAFLNFHQPQEAWSKMGNDGNCSPKTLKVTRLGKSVKISWNNTLFCSNSHLIE